MARVEAIAKGLFYPTPMRVVKAIALHLQAETGKGRRARLLDPCSGTGAPAAWVADALGAESFGIELNEQRAAQSRAMLDHVLPGNANYDVRLGHGGYSALFLNPPYDSDAVERREEHKFLTRFTPMLCTDGILIWIVPQERLNGSSHYLCAHYSDHAAFRFPDPEFGAFGQVVLFARKKRAAVYDSDVRRQLEAWSKADLPELPDNPDEALLTVPALREGEVLFAPEKADPEVARYLALRSGVMSQRAVLEMIRPDEETMVTPLMYLRRGHLAMLMVSGLADDFLIRNRPDSEEKFLFLVKGQQIKRMIAVEVSEEEAKRGVTREREQLETTMQVLNLLTGELWICSDALKPKTDQPESLAA